MIFEGQWLSLNGKGEGDPLYELKRDWTTVSGLQEGKRAFKLVADIAGDYTFTWTYGNGTLVITFPPTTPTAIDNAAVEGKAVKTIENGMLIIEKNGVRYNALGQVIR